MSTDIANMASSLSEARLQEAVLEMFIENIMNIIDITKETARINAYGVYRRSKGIQFEVPAYDDYVDRTVRTYNVTKLQVNNAEYALWGENIQFTALFKQLINELPNINDEIFQQLKDILRAVCFKIPDSLLIWKLDSKFATIGDSLVYIRNVTNYANKERAKNKNQKCIVM
jgi:hypothetical protein